MANLVAVSWLPSSTVMHRRKPNLGAPKPSACTGFEQHCREQRVRPRHPLRSGPQAGRRRSAPGRGLTPPSTPGTAAAVGTEAAEAAQMI